MSDLSFSSSASLRSGKPRHAAVALTLAAIAAATAGGCSNGPPDATPGDGTTATAAAASSVEYARLSHGARAPVQPEADRGPMDPTKRIANLSLVFKLTPEQLKDREALKAALVDPASPQYRKFLTPAQYAARFGAPAAQVARAKTWLAEQGLEVHRDSPLGARVTFSGSVDAIQTALRSEVRRYEVGGKMHYAMRTAPSLPKDIADGVAEVTNLHDFHARPMSHIKPAPEFTPPGSTTPGFTVPDWANVYDAAPLYTKGINGTVIDGTGVTIAVVGVADIAASDIAAWRSTLGIAASTLTKTLVPNTGAAAGGTEGAGFEAVLDVEWAGGVAPAATINFVFTGEDDGNVDDATYYAIENNLGGVINESFGGCEGYYIQGGIMSSDQNVIDVYGSAANVLGITYVAASGDAGADTCAQDPTAPSGIWVSLPAAYPGVTAVGGTEFPKGALTGTPYFTAYSATEATWNELNSPPNVAAGGGGVSMLFSRPSYQTGVASCTPVGSFPVSGVMSATQRQVPDVAFTAAGVESAHIPLLEECTLNPNTNDCSNTGGSPKFSAGGGTSFASPAFAGVVALMSQAAGGRLGNINPALYNLASSTPTAFHDIALGNNEIACKSTDTGCTGGATYGYAAVAGYDCATGLGSMDVYNAVAALAGQAATTTSLSVTPTAATEASPESFTATVKVAKPNATVLNGVVTFAFESTDAMGNPDLSWTLGTGKITGGSTSAGTATFSGTVPPGLVKPGMQTVNVYASYGGDPAHLPSTSAAVALTFGSITFALSPSAPTVAPNGAVTFSSTGGVSPVKWYTGLDSTCDANFNCSTINETTGAFVAGPTAGTTQVFALDADGAEALTTVNVVCTPVACTAMDCGTISDGCGNTETCPNHCAAPMTCGGGGNTTQCGCAALTACPSTDTCGSISDGCGGMISCGTCPSGQTCSANSCIVSASTTSSSSTATSSSSSSGGAGGSTTTTTSTTTSSGGQGDSSSKGCSIGAARETSNGPTRGQALAIAALAGLLVSRRRRAS